MKWRCTRGITTAGKLGQSHFQTTPLTPNSLAPSPRSPRSTPAPPTHVPRPAGAATIASWHCHHRKHSRGEATHADPPCRSCRTVRALGARLRSRRFPWTCPRTTKALAAAPAPTSAGTTCCSTALPTVRRALAAGHQFEPLGDWLARQPAPREGRVARGTIPGREGWLCVGG